MVLTFKHNLLATSLTHVGSITAYKLYLACIRHSDCVDGAKRSKQENSEGLE